MKASDTPIALPSAEEIRMVRAIVMTALTEAARHGVYRATFGVFSVEAVRHAEPVDVRSTAAVSLRVRFAGELVETCNVSFADKPATYRLPARIQSIPASRNHPQP